MAARTLRDNRRANFRNKYATVRPAAVIESAILTMERHRDRLTERRPRCPNELRLVKPGLLYLDRLDVIHEDLDAILYLPLGQRRGAGASERALPVHESVTPDRHLARTV